MSDQALAGGSNLKLFRRGVPDASLTLKVDFQGTRVVHISCAPTEAISSVQTKVFEALGVPCEQQILLFGVQALSPLHKPLCWFGIDNDTRVVLFLNTADQVERMAFRTDPPNVGALYNMGYLLEYGQAGVRKDTTKAIHAYGLAASLGHGPACNYLSYCYREGKNAAVDEPKALELLKKASALGNISSITTLGYMYSNGTGVEKDTMKAYRLFSRASEAGSAISTFNLGVMHEVGMGVDRCERRALEFYAKAYRLGNPSDRDTVAAGCQDILGVIFGVDEDDEDDLERCARLLAMVHRLFPPTWPDLFQCPMSESSLRNALERPGVVHRLVYDICSTRNEWGDTLLSVLSSIAEAHSSSWNALGMVANACARGHARWEAARWTVAMGYFLDGSCAFAVLPAEIFAHIISMVKPSAYSCWEEVVQGGRSKGEPMAI